MRCTTYCTAALYDIPKLFQELQLTFSAQLFRDCLHVSLAQQGQSGDIFYFSYGCVVFWGFTEDEEIRFLNTLKERAEKDSRPKAELDEFTFIYGEQMKIEEDEIMIQPDTPLIKLAISHGLAQSVKLATFEEAIQKTIDNTKNLPEDLALKGKILLSRKDISRKMGELFIERNFVNLNSEILETPEFFWNYPELEPFYRRTAHYLELSKRIDILNKRLTVIHELFEILNNELKHQHTSRLEWTIIILIVIEIVIAMMRDIFHLL